jgi:hypothetical protein
MGQAVSVRSMAEDREERAHARDEGDLLVSASIRSVFARWPVARPKKGLGGVTPAPVCGATGSSVC